LGHVADAEACATLGRELAQIGPGELDHAGRRRQQPHDALEQRGLPHAVAAHETGARSGGHGAIDIPERMAAAVGLVEAGDRERAHAPRYTSMTRGSFCTWS